MGLTQQNRTLLVEWLRILELILPHMDQLRTLCLGERTLLFQVSDQDALIVHLYSTDSRESLLGREAMDFIPGGYTMSHAVGSENPWRNWLLASAFGGYCRRPRTKAFGSRSSIRSGYTRRSHCWQNASNCESQHLSIVWCAGVKPKNRF